LPAAAAIKTIDSRYFRLSRITDLNDPFEWSFGFDASQPENIEKNRRERDGLIHHLNEQYGLICFCERVKDPVIWSHYADCHRGIATQVSAELNEGFIQVKYPPQRLILPENCLANRHQNIAAFTDVFGEFVRFKAPSWEHEREWRAIVPLD
jgi:hypothetical protein